MDAGTSKSKSKSSSKGDKEKKTLPRPESRDLFEITSDNGYLLCDKYFIPEEILAQILSYLPAKELVFNCRKVCKWWCNVIDSLVWRNRMKRINVPINKVIELPWFACYLVEKKVALNRNFVKNNCGQEGMKHWTILSAGGDGWKVERPPQGCDKFPDDSALPRSSKNPRKLNSCFATSYYSCTKEQLINLCDEGLSPEFMDTIQPKISLIDWCAGRFDCGCVYEIQAKLLDKDKQPLTEFYKRHHLGAQDGSDWRKISHVFQDYGPGVRYIVFYHGGMDSQFWKGHYGCKITGTAITALV